MRSFIIAALILVCIIGAVIYSAAYTVNATDDLLILCDEIIAEKDSSLIDTILNKWHKHRTFFSFTVNRHDIERVDNAFLAIDICRNNSNEFSYRLHELKSALRSVAESGRLSWEIIF